MVEKVKENMELTQSVTKPKRAHGTMQPKLGRVDLKNRLALLAWILATEWTT